MGLPSIADKKHQIYGVREGSDVPEGRRAKGLVNSETNLNEFAKSL
jgi:hypothetical protein